MSRLNAVRRHIGKTGRVPIRVNGRFVADYDPDEDTLYVRQHGKMYPVDLRQYRRPAVKKNK